MHQITFSKCDSKTWSLEICHNNYVHFAMYISKSEFTVHCIIMIYVKFVCWNYDHVLRIITSNWEA